MFTIKPTSRHQTFYFSFFSSLYSKGFFLLSFIFFLGLESVIKPAHAYIGPGLGLGSLMVVIGLGLSVLLAFFAIFWYPIKRMIFGSSEPLDQDDDDLHDDHDD